MADTVFIDNFSLTGTVTLTVPFGGVASIVIIHNKNKCFPVKVFFRDTPTTFNATPITILPEQKFPFIVETDAIELLSDVTMSEVEVMAIFKATTGTGGIGAVVHFDYTTTFPLTIASLVPGDKLKRAVIVITTAFNAGVTMSLGFPADTDEIAKTTQSRLNRVETWIFPAYRISAVSETLNSYLFGTPTVGEGFICIE